MISVSDVRSALASPPALLPRSSHLDGNDRIEKSRNTLHASRRSRAPESADYTKSVTRQKKQHPDSPKKR
jgi:hypothetical protein